MAETNGHEGKVVGVASYETKLLAERLKKAVVAESYDVVTYEELSNIIAKDVRTVARSHLNSARRIVEKETGRLLGCVEKQGVKLLEPIEQVSVGPDAIQRIRRATNRTIGRLGRVQVDKLNDSQKTEFHATASVIGAVRLFTQAKSIEKITSVVKTTSDKLPIGDTLKIFVT